MSSYLCKLIVFKYLKDFFPDAPATRRVAQIKYGVKTLLVQDDDARFLMMSAHATNTQLYQRNLLHNEVPARHQSRVHGYAM